jgi:hypothetical protein
MTDKDDQPPMPEKWDVPSWAEMLATDRADAEASEATDRAIYDALSRAIAEKLNTKKGNGND